MVLYVDSRYGDLVLDTPKGRPAVARNECSHSKLPRLHYSPIEVSDLCQGYHSSDSSGDDGVMVGI